MPEARFAFQSVTAPTGNWNEVVSTDPATFAAIDLIDIDSGADTGWNLAGTEVGTVGDAVSGMNQVGSGDAAWVDQAVISDELWFSSATTVGFDFTFSGMDTGKTYTIECFSSNDTTATRISDFTIGAQTLTLDGWDNTTLTAEFTGIAPDGSGNIALSWRRNASSSGNGVINALRVIEEAGGGAITGNVPLTLSVTSTLTGAGALAGAVPLSITPVGALTGTGALSGDVALTMTPAGALTGAGTLASSVGLSFDIAGDLTSQDAGAVVGSVPVTLAVTGALTGTGALLGSIQMDLTAAGVFQAAAQETSGGGFIVDYEREQIRRAKERRRRRELEEESEQIEEETTRQIAALLREQEAKDARRAELARLSDLVARTGSTGDTTALSPRVLKAIRTAAAKQTAWALFQLEREMHRAQEEEQFLLQALSIAVHYYE